MGRFVRSKFSAFLAGLGMLLAAAPALAHHSFAAEYDENQPTTLKGTVTKLDWVNPHAWIYVDVKGPDGKVVNWAIQTGAPSALLKRGLRKDDFRVGMQIIVEAHRAKEKAATAAPDSLL